MRNNRFIVLKKFNGGKKKISVTLLSQLCLSKLMLWNICNPSWLDILRQTSKFAFSGVDSWCNVFDVADVFSQVNNNFFYYRCWLSNLLNWWIFGMLVLGYLYDLIEYQKNLNGKIRVLCKNLFCESSAVGTIYCRAITWQI